MNQFAAFSDSEWLDALSIEREKYAHLLPALPPESEQKRFTGKSGRDAFSESVSFYSLVLDLARERGVKLDPSSRIVDLGCGWGRISQTAYRDFEPHNILSIDIHEDAIENCRRSGLTTTLVRASPEPPTILRTGVADIAVAYSVFSHLSEEAHWNWLRELHRLVRPGGIVVVTTRAKAMITYVQSLRGQQDLPPHAGDLAAAFADIEKTLESYENGEYIFDIPRSTGVFAGIYGEAVIPPLYVEREWKKLFRDVAYLGTKELNSSQAIIVCTT